MCDNFESDTIRSVCGQVVGTGWSMIVNWVKYEKAKPRDICVSISFCENGGRDLSGDEDGGHQGGGGDGDGQGGHQGGAGGRQGGQDEEGGDGFRRLAPGEGRRGQDGRDGLDGRDGQDGQNGRKASTGSRGGDFGASDANNNNDEDDRARQAEREREAETGGQDRKRRSALPRHRRHAH